MCVCARAHIHVLKVALNIAYNLACLKQEENMFVSYPPAVLRGLPPLLQELLVGATALHAALR